MGTISEVIQMCNMETTEKQPSCCAGLIRAPQCARLGSKQPSILGRSVSEVTKTDTYLSEAALWTSWTHRGTAVARETTMVIQINSDAFANEVRKDEEVH